MLYSTTSLGNIAIKPQGKNTKDAIKQPILSEKNIIPRLLTSCIIVGRSGSGKSVLTSALLNGKTMLGDAFDLVVLISPTASTDDVQMSFPVTSEECVVDDLKKAPEFLDGLMGVQKKKIQEFGADQAPLVCVIFDDCAGDTKFLNCKEFTACFTRSRHYNFTVFCLTQQYKNIPKRCRLQCNNLMFFKSPDTESEAVCDDHTPPNYSKNKFMELIHWATHEKHSFLYINMKEPFETRYRRNFSEIINLQCESKRTKRKRSTKQEDTSLKENNVSENDTEKEGEGFR